jgi:Alcohol dehydrogenase GroES-like domain
MTGSSAVNRSRAPAASTASMVRDARLAAVISVSGCSGPRTRPGTGSSAAYWSRALAGSPASPAQRAASSHSYGGPEVQVLEPGSSLEPGPGRVRLRQAAAGVSFLDIYYRRGEADPASGLPFVNGFEGAGVIEAVGPDVPAHLEPGLRVGDTLAIGAYATHRLAPAARLVPLPDSVDDEQPQPSCSKGPQPNSSCAGCNRSGPAMSCWSMRRLAVSGCWSLPVGKSSGRDRRRLAGQSRDRASSRSLRPCRRHGGARYRLHYADSRGGRSGRSVGRLRRRSRPDAERFPRAAATQRDDQRPLSQGEVDRPDQSEPAALHIRSGGLGGVDQRGPRGPGQRRHLGRDPPCLSPARRGQSPCRYRSPQDVRLGRAPDHGAVTLTGSSQMRVGRSEQVARWCRRTGLAGARR